MGEIIKPEAVAAPPRRNFGDVAAPLQKPGGVPDWMWTEVSAYDLPFREAPRTLLDIGANIGAFTALANQRWPAAVIDAYEPIETPLPGLTADWHHSAVRATAGPQDIFLGDRSVTNSFHQLGRQTAATARVTCVDAATLPSADFIKIDTEGCETEILSRLDLNETKVIAVEYHRVEDAEILRDLAEQNGFELYQEKPLGPTWGLLIFAKPGALRSCVRQNAANQNVSHAVPSAATKVFLALPVYGALDPFFTQSLIQFLNEPPLPIMLRMNPGDSLVSRARNTLTADFLASDATHLLFIDSDIIFSADQVARIMAHSEDIVGGFYPKKQSGEVQWVCNGHLTPTEPRADGLQSVRYMGTGFLRISRRVFIAMIEAFGDQLRYTTDHHPRCEYDFWSVGTYQYPDGSRRFLSEDWFFCQRALDLGFTVWGDTRIVLRHVGQAIYPLPTQAQQIFGTPFSTTATDTAGPRVLAPAIPAEPFAKGRESRVESRAPALRPSTLDPRPATP